MANIPIWPGSSSFASVYNTFYYSGSLPSPTPFGFYDNDAQFQTDANRVANFCALRLGYPIENVELQNINFWAAFEEATTVYGNELYAFQTRDNYLSLEGASTNTNVNNTLLTPSFETIVRLSQQYGEEAGVGGNITWYKGQLLLNAGQQKYDLKQWAIDEGITGGIEIKRVFYQPPPAINQLYSPMLGTGPGGLGGVPAAGVYGLGYGYTNYMMMPTSFTMQNINAIEMQNTVTLSNYTFELINNIISVFPIPGTGLVDGFGGEFDGFLGHYLVFEFIKMEDRINSAFANGDNLITNTSNVPYVNPIYSQINSIGRSWIFEYTLALSKEMLGYVRGKYSQIPIPGSEVTLNQGDLISAATSERTALIERLRTYFDTTSRKTLLANKAEEAQSQMNILNDVPMTIFIG
jgi:hypothetical protein